MDTSGICAPFASLTVPVIVPRSLCASSGPQINANKKKQRFIMSDYIRNACYTCPKMNRGFLAALTLASAAFLSCGVNRKRAAPAPPLPPVVAAVLRPAEVEPEEEQEDSYKEAAEFYLLRRALPGGDLPAERFIEAKRRAERMPLYSLAQRRFVDASQKGAARDAALGSWEALGPGNIGGRTRSMLIHPADANTIYAGSVGGGVWKTTDGGASWTPLTDLLASLGASALAMDPKDPSVLYAGTGEWYTASNRGDSIRGAGIFKSTDAGSTWTQLTATANSFFYYTNKIVVSPNDSRRIYVATYGGVWFSGDAGATWRRVLDRTGPNVGCQDLVIRSDQPVDYLLAACGTVPAPQTVVFRNTDAAGAGQ